MNNSYTKSNKATALLLSVLLLSSCSTNIEDKRTFGGTHFSNTEETIETEALKTERTKKLPFNTTAAPEEGSEASSATTEEELPLFTQAEIEDEIILTAGTSQAETAVEITTASEAETTTEAVTTEAPAETTAATFGTVEGSYNVIGDSGILVSYMDGHYRGLMPCFGTYGYCDGWIAAANKFKEKLPLVNVYNMVVPTSSEFYIPKGYESGFTTSQYNKISYIAEGLENVTDIDAYSALKAHTDEEIFSRTDHHWFPLGGYYAAEEFASVAGIEFPKLSEYKKVSCKGYVGSLYNYSGDSHLYNDPEEFVMYIPPNNNKLKTTYYNTSFGGGYESELFVASDASAYYCSFLGSDDRIAEIETNVKNGRTLVIFKESYGNALVPFLTSGYEKIYVCDIRYFTPNAVDFCKEVGATDLLFAVCTYTPAGTNGKYLGNIINQ